MTSSGTQMIVGLIIGVAVLVYLILRTKVHAFLALILASALTGLIGGMPPVEVGKAITTGFGNTLGSIGIVIGFGVMMGRLLEVSGAAQRMAYTFLRYLGRGREEWALAATGYVVSIPIFCDSGFVILAPLAKALSSRTGKSIVTLGVALAVGLVATHHAVPPTPGPLGVAGIFGVDVGVMILWGLLMAIPVTIAGVLYATWLGRRIYQIPSPDGTGWVRPERQVTTQTAAAAEEESSLPPTWLSFGPIVLPILLIFLNTALTAAKAQSPLAQFLIFLGNPVIAVGIGLLLAIYGLMGAKPRAEVIKRMEEGVASAGIIILITGAGGALGQVLRASGTGDFVAQLIARTALPAVLLPFAVATLVRLVQGSGTVAMITSASITAPILAQLNVHPALAAQAATLGAMVFSYFNDSYFWVVNRMLGIEDVKEQTLTWSITTTIGWAVGLVTLLIANALVG